jgi:hypothetical protein
MFVKPSAKRALLIAASLMLLGFVVLKFTRTEEDLDQVSSEVRLESIRHRNLDEITDIRFRMRSQNCDQSDVEDYCECMFLVWISDPAWFPRLLEIKHAYSPEQMEILKRVLHGRDPLRIRRFAPIELAEDAEYYGLYTRGAGGEKLRVKLVWKASLRLQPIGSYENAVEMFNREMMGQLPTER